MGGKIDTHINIKFQFIMIRMVSNIGIQYNIRDASTMHRRSLDENVGIDQYNKKLFGAAMEMVGKCKKIPIGLVSQHYKHQSIKDKYQLLQSKLNNIFKILGRFSQADKPPLGDSLDFGLEILEETKVLIETQIKRISDERNTLKKNTTIKNRKKLPQDLYPGLGVYQDYSPHEHRDFLEQGRIPMIPICQSITPSRSMDEVLVYVDSQAKLQQCISQLKQSREIAIDVEHNNKNYEGLTCLVQISTRQKDYIIDVFPIWRKVHALNEVISDPNIIKVMHGADMDTKWLQRDFNIHIVNLFDTHKASRVLGMAKFSYAYLLQNYCGVATNKMYQRADWRDRPLIPEMILYARMDTHYLLSIYDSMRMDLQRQAKQLNLEVGSVFFDIQKSSHEVTLIQNEPFTYKNRELYQNLEYQFSRSKQKVHFAIVQAFLWALNKTAKNNDQNFDDLAPKRILVESIAILKDLIYNKNSKASKKSRVQRILSILRKNDNQHIDEAVRAVQKELQNYFLNTKNEDLGDQLPQIRPAKKKQHPRNVKNRLQQLSENILALNLGPEQKFVKQEKQPTCFTEHLQGFFSENININPSKPKFMPILNFLSQKYGIRQKARDSEMEEQESEQQDDEEMQNPVERVEQPKKEQQQEQGVIQFRRMNPNVIYTIEAPEDPEIAAAMKQKQPRKKRKELEYESRLKNKTGNIYDLLED